MPLSNSLHTRGASVAASIDILAAQHAEQSSQPPTSAMLRNGRGTRLNVSVVSRSASPIAAVRSVSDPERTVTPRQLELLALYASGYSYKDIATTKFLSPYTVQRHLSDAVARVGARSVTHLCVVVFEAGMIRRNSQGVYEPIQDLRIAGEGDE